VGPPPATLDLPVSMVVLRGSQAVGLGPHLSHLIYIYKSKITKYMYMVSSRALWKSLVGSFLKPGATSVWRILYPLPEIVIHIFTKAHILFCLPCSRYTRFSPRLACGPPKLMGPGWSPLSVDLIVYISDFRLNINWIYFYLGCHNLCQHMSHFRSKQFFEVVYLVFVFVF
jgi:hypothetical protein